MLSPRQPGVKRVPCDDIGFIPVPAQEDDLAVSDVIEVHEPTVGVLELAPHSMEFRL